MRRDREGVPKNFVQAYMWYLLTKSNLSKSNYKISGTLEQSMDNIRNKMTPDQISESQKLAQDWINKFQI